MKFNHILKETHQAIEVNHDQVSLRCFLYNHFCNFGSLGLNLVNFGIVWVEKIFSVSCIPLGNWIPPAGKWKRESGDNFSQFFSGTGCFELKPQGNYFCPCPISGLILLKFVCYSFINILIVSDEGGGLLGGQQGTFPSGQDVFPSLLGGLFRCCRFALDFNKHHQGVKKSEGDKKSREVIKEYFRYLRQYKIIFSRSPRQSSVHPIQFGSWISLCGQLFNYSIRGEWGSGDMVVTMGLINGKPGECWNGGAFVGAAPTKEWSVWNKGRRTTLRWSPSS